MKCGEEYNSACCSDSGIPNHRVHRDFILYCKCLKIHRPAAIIINIVIIFLIFRWVGMEVLSVFFAVLFILKEIAQYYLLWGLERRIMRPIATLKRGVGSIAKGDYSVRISNDVNNEIGVLIDEFNIMAEKLEQSEKIKVEYEENRKNLIANISHDLKTPITSISGYIEAILDGVTTEPDKINKYLKTIQSYIFYINNLIDDLFLFSKLDMQKLNFQFEKVNIKAFLADAMEEFKFVLGEQGINCSYDDIPGDFEVNIDRKRIYQVIRNIIGNAVKYGRENPNIKVELQDDKEFIRINITDNGPGIAEDKLPFVFDRFYRIDTERTKDLMSTGLGLAIAKELIEAHRGRIKVSSVLNEGSCFSIMLPKVL
jgi:signal transduction histidine kinase